MTTNSSILVGKIPWTEEPGRLQSMWVTRVRHDSATKQQPTRKNLLAPQAARGCPGNPGPFLSQESRIVDLEILF